MQKAYRLKKNASFSYIYKNGKAFRTDYMVLYFVRAYNTKVGISISRKIGKAVVRNKVKRRANAIFANVIPNIEGTYNYVLLAKPGIADLSYQELEKEIITALQKTNHLKTQPTVSLSNED